MNDYRILVVDDEEDLCEILKFNLENEGYFVDTAKSAEAALKMELTQMCTRDSLYTNVFQKLGIGFAGVNNLDGYDEISLTDEFKAVSYTHL